MNLNEVAGLLGASSPEVPLEIPDLAYDSRRVGPGSLFFCIPGTRYDGHDFAAPAVEAGAVSIVCERPLPLDVPQLLIGDARSGMNRVAAPFYGNPSRRLKLAAITGTKGKTTISWLLDSIFSSAGERAGLIGTIEIRFDHEASPGVRTTPQSIDLQRLLRRMVDAGVGSCVMEATSIGIHQGRVQGCEFDVAVFTNLSRDHLDEYHGTMDAYYAAKKTLFSADRVERALVNADDPWGARLAGEIDVSTITFSLGGDADLVATGISAIGFGSRFRAVGAGIDLEVAPRLPGMVNVSNALAAVGVAHLLGVDHEAIRRGIAALEVVPGRFERIDEGQDFVVLVDYAHTPDSLREALATARGLAGGRVILVFGCGGDRDRAKRPLMGETSQAAEVVIVTSDNPRGEDPLAIIGDIEKGISRPPGGGYRSITDRAEAVETAIAQARAGDVVLIAGKGHETGQEFAGATIPFDDREVARAALRRLR